MIVDVTIYEPRGVLSGWIKRKSGLNWADKFFRIENNLEVGGVALVQHPYAQQNTTDDQWGFSQIENLVFGIDERAAYQSLSV